MGNQGRLLLPRLAAAGWRVRAYDIAADAEALRGLGADSDHDFDGSPAVLRAILGREPTRLSAVLAREYAHHLVEICGAA